MPINKLDILFTFIYVFHFKTISNNCKINSVWNIILGEMKNGRRAESNQKTFFMLINVYKIYLHKYKLFLKLFTSNRQKRYLVKLKKCLKISFCTFSIITIYKAFKVYWFKKLKKKIAQLFHFIN